ncbi:phenylacetate--CoA ligase family protein [Shewanella sp. GutDb-MelDb]|uniref:phenylacetate--CoA ligase family protein n=1 Tax=Shewanella sp. GutDb-MelDb TaxID=2058316 RepID=UPI000C7C6408|nr:AMP-binding protein [Shewanella sp. GutDb-MelDb]PKG58467.1 AMP-dependent synthetase [Shewanella sp. GutDb-MelDb]
MSFFSAQEQQAATLREATLMSRLSDFLCFAQESSDYYHRVLANIDLSQINSRSALAALPITRKSDLIKLQAANMPFAGMVPNMSGVGRVFQSPGPIYEPEADGHDWWRMGQAFFAAGFRAGDLVQNCLSYHLTPGGFIMDSGAKACGCSVIPAGPGQTEMQLDIIHNLQPNSYCGTPSFLKILLDKAKLQQQGPLPFSKALVTGEALTPALKAVFDEADIEVKQAYATADIGLIAFESVADAGLVVAEDIILEIVRPGSLAAVKRGEVGEVVITSFNPNYPLIRFATGDLSAQLDSPSDCGRTNMRIKGWLGRADQTTKVKGLFIHPEQVERVRLYHSAIKRVRLVVCSENDNDKMCLLCEVDDNVRLNIDIVAIQQSIRAVTQLSSDVSLVAIGSMLDDGIVIEDQR